MLHTETEPANRINHFVLNIDMTLSMRHRTAAVLQVVRNFIESLAAQSRELDQETRVTIYVFNSHGIKCLVYDKDVLRVPSIEGRYHAEGNTPLIAATCQSIDEVGETPQRYGEHSFVIFSITDGEENWSSRMPVPYYPEDLRHRIESLGNEWTVAAFVPDAMGVSYAKRAGFPAGNIDKWDATTDRGVHELGDRITSVSRDFMEARTRGVRGSRSIFTVTQVTPQAAAAVLDPLPHGRYDLADVPYDMPVNEFAALVTGRPYRKGSVFYQLTKPVTIQNYKDVMVQTRSDGRVYTGPAARQLLGLPEFDAKVSPTTQPGTVIFIQSTSVNRKMIGGTTGLILK